MIVVKNDALTPVETTVLDGNGKEKKVIIPGRGWRKVEETERTPALEAVVAAGTLRTHTLPRPETLTPPPCGGYSQADAP
jgi:hypothetical protein